MPERDNISRFFLSPELKFISSKRFKSGHLWEVEKLRQSFEVCPKCATPSNVRCGRATTTVRESPLQGNALWLKIHKHRYFCKPCRKPFTEPVSGIYPRRRSTQWYRKTIMRKCIDFVALSKVRTTLKCSSGLMYKVFYEQIEMKLREHSGQHWPSRLGIDEHFFSRRKGYTEFATVFTNLNKGKLFELALGKSKKDLIEQIKDIPGRENVLIVAMDLSRGYRSFVRELFPNAKIVADKFHVLRLPAYPIIKEKTKIHGHRKELQLRRLLLKNRQSLEYFARSELDRYLKNYPKLDELYRAKEKLHLLYRTKGVHRARRALDKLLAMLKASPLEELIRLGRTLKTWKNEILQYFEHRVTNALSEAINSKAKTLQKRACGYKSFKNYRLRLLSACAF